MGGEVKLDKGTVVSAGSDRPPITKMETGDLVVGGEGAGGDVLVRDADNVTRIVLNAGGPDQGTMASIGTRVYLDGGTAKVRFGGGDTDGVLTLQRANGDTTLALQATDGTMAGLWAGNSGRNGWVVLRGTTGKNRVWLDGGEGEVTLFNGSESPSIRLKGSGGSGWFGGAGEHGDLLLFPASVATPTTDNASIWLEGEDGAMTMRNGAGKTTIQLKGAGGSGWFGGRGEDGDLLLFPATEQSPSSDNASVWIQGKTGDIVLRNADCAEEFDVRAEDGVGPGSVLVLDADGQLVMCRDPYDCRVAGVVSGAAGIRPGIVLGRVPGAEDRLPVALAGKVVCNVDASYGPIRVGSLLTTSPRPGYAMVASDRDRAFGAVIGKAMAPLDSGLGAVPMLVGLQ
ncbi:MAG: hypothetical protein ABMA64_21110 [Myxococcota bacterium]